jgi:hypothetical protein
MSQESIESQIALVDEGVSIKETIVKKIEQIRKGEEEKLDY